MHIHQSGHGQPALEVDDRSISTDQTANLRFVPHRHNPAVPDLAQPHGAGRTAEPVCCLEVDGRELNSHPVNATGRSTEFYPTFTRAPGDTCHIPLP